MASFICTLSLFLLVLANGYFTLPMIYETHPIFNESGHETTEIPEHMTRSATDSMELGVTTEEMIPQGLRLAPNDDKDELSTPETISHELREVTELPDTLKMTTEKIPEQHHSGSHSHGGESESAEETGNKKPKPYQRRGMSDESTTTTTPAMPSHLTSSSTIIPEGHTTSSTSTHKYTGLLKNDESEPTEGEHSEKPNKPRPKPEEPTVTLPSALIEPGSLPDPSSRIDGVMQFDENTIPAITDFPTTTMAGKPKPPKKPLNEGKEPSQSEEEKSD